ncbi:MAG: VWA domain-containing protein [Gammaproteobacteria bacterium]|nr:VWA domain-containing protein [Gammaproteobacteria bacterium]
MQRRRLSTFSLSFIDSILCGFGAVVLLFLIVSANTLAHRNELTRDLRSETDRLEQAVLDQRKKLAVTKNTLEDTDVERVRLEGLAAQLIRQLEDMRQQLAEYDKANLARVAHLNRLKADVQSKEEAAKRLKAGATRPTKEGDRLREFRGQGDRQYLTGLKVGGKHILILIDTSASMLGERIVDVVRRRNLPDEDKRRAPKWQRAVNTVDWLATQLPMTAKFQVYGFNEDAEAVTKGTARRWLDAGDPGALNKAVAALREKTPEKGTSLHNALAAVKTLHPRPDNVFLLTDGLPTRGKGKGWRKNVSPRQRLALYSEAVKELPSSIPVNVILFPMEGDPAAASAFWKMAKSSKGSFFSPARDWP